jgi:ADP-heptose:LPS heptosyltransferase
LIGLSWRGNPDYKGDVERSLPLSELRELLAVAGVQFVSLQKELSEGERALTGSLPNFVHPGGNFAATAELVAALDLVISVDTVWAHWAGAIGKPVCVLLPYAPHWCWLLDRDDSPWYPTARLFRQTEPGVWGEAVARVVRHVSQLPP